MQAEALLEKIKTLPPDKIVEVEDFVEFLARKSSVKQNLHQEIAAFAEEFGGTELDLDEELEATSIEHLSSEASDETW